MSNLPSYYSSAKTLPNSDNEAPPPYYVAEASNPPKRNPLSFQYPSLDTVANECNIPALIALFKDKKDIETLAALTIDQLQDLGLTKPEALRLKKYLFSKRNRSI